MGLVGMHCVKENKEWYLYLVTRSVEGCHEWSVCCRSVGSRPTKSTRGACNEIFIPIFCLKVNKKTTIQYCDNFRYNILPAPAMDIAPGVIAGVRPVDLPPEPGVAGVPGIGSRKCS